MKVKSHDEVINLLDGKQALPTFQEVETITIPVRHKIVAALFFIAVGALLFYYKEYAYYYFVMFLALSIQCYLQGEWALVAITLVVQISAWLIAFFFFYVGFFNIIFPRIRGVNEMRTKNTFARKVIAVNGPDPNYSYMKVKFTLLPLFNWYTMKVPKKCKWVRMPSSLDIHSPSIDLVWKDNMYVVTTNPLTRLPDADSQYSIKAKKSIKVIGETIGDAIQGDSKMMKDYYTMNLVMDENREPIPKKNLTPPPSDLERETNGI